MWLGVNPVQVWRRVTPSNPHRSDRFVGLNPTREMRLTVRRTPESGFSGEGPRLQPWEKEIKVIPEEVYNVLGSRPPNAPASDRKGYMKYVRWVSENADLEQDGIVVRDNGKRIWLSPQVIEKFKGRLNETNYTKRTVAGGILFTS